MSGSATAVYLSAFLTATINPNAATPIPQRQMVATFALPVQPTLRMQAAFVGAASSQTMNANFLGEPAETQTLAANFLTPPQPVAVMSANFLGATQSGRTVEANFLAPASAQRVMEANFLAPPTVPARTVDANFLATPTVPQEVMQAQFGPSGTYTVSPLTLGQYQTFDRAIGSYGVGPLILGQYRGFGQPIAGSYSVSAASLPGSYAVGAPGPGIYNVSTIGGPGAYLIGSPGQAGAYSVGDLTLSLPVEMRCNFLKIPNPDPPGGVKVGMTMRGDFIDGFYVSRDWPRPPQMSASFLTQTYGTAPAGAAGIELPPQPAIYVYRVIPNTPDDCRVNFAITNEALIAQ